MPRANVVEIISAVAQRSMLTPMHGDFCIVTLRRPTIIALSDGRDLITDFGITSELG